MDVAGVVAASNTLARTHLATEVGTAVLAQAIETSTAAVATLLDRALPMGPSDSRLGQHLDLQL